MSRQVYRLYRGACGAEGDIQAQPSTRVLLNFGAVDAAASLVALPIALAMQSVLTSNIVEAKMSLAVVLHANKTCHLDVQAVLAREGHLIRLSCAQSQSLKPSIDLLLRICHASVAGTMSHLGDLAPTAPTHWRSTLRVTRVLGSMRSGLRQVRHAERCRKVFPFLETRSSCASLDAPAKVDFTRLQIAVAEYNTPASPANCISLLDITWCHCDALDQDHAADLCEVHAMYRLANQAAALIGFRISPFSARVA